MSVRTHNRAERISVLSLVGMGDELRKIAAANDPVESLRLNGLVLGQLQLEKLANLTGLTGPSAAPANPTALSEIKPSTPVASTKVHGMGGAAPKYSKVQSAPIPSPMSGLQPTSEPPAVRR